VTTPVVRTLLMCDLVDSTRMTVELGDQESAGLMRRIDRATRDLVAAHDGREIDKTDGYLILFERPADAVQVAISLHRALREISAEIGVDVQIRVGIHLGEVLLHENSSDDVARGAKPIELDGLAKPLVARVMSHATGGQTLMTQGGFDLARRAAVGDEGLQDLLWRDAGEFLPKGMSEPVTVFAVSEVGRSAAPTPAPIPAPGPEAPSPAPSSSLPALALGAAGLVVMGIITLWWTSAPALETAHYAFVGWTSAGPDGVGEPVETLPPWGAYEVTRERGVVTRIRAVTSTGDPSWATKSAPGFRLAGPQQRGLEGEQSVGGVHSYAGNSADAPPTWIAPIRDENGVLFRVEERTDERLVASVAVTWQADGSVVTLRSDHAGNPTENSPFWNLSANREITFDEVGWAATEAFLAPGGGEPRGGGGVFSIAFERDERGYPTQVTNRSRSGDPIANDAGVVTAENVWGGRWNGVTTQRRGLGLGDVPALIFPDCHALRLSHHDDGYTIACDGPDGEPARVARTECHAERHSWTPSTYDYSCLDESGELKRNKQGFAAISAELDERGYHRVHQYLDVDRQPTDTMLNASRVTFAWQGTRLVEVQCTNRAGEACSKIQTAFNLRRDYDASGRLSAVVQLDPEGDPVLGSSGWAIRNNRYDEAGYLAGYAWFDDAAAPMHHPFGVHALALEHDETGQLTAHRWLGIGGVPVTPAQLGYAEVRIARDGDVTEQSWFTADGGPGFGELGNSRSSDDIPRPEDIHARGFHSLRTARDASGRITAYELLDAEGSPVRGSTGWSVARLTHEGTRLARVDYAGVDGEPVNLRRGFASVTWEWTPRGLPKKTETRDVDGMLVTDPVYGCASTVLEYGNRDAWDELICKDPAGVPVVHRLQGAPWLRRIRDQRDRHVGNLYLDKDGQPAPNHAGVVEDRLLIDDHGRQLGRSFHDAAGNPVRHGNHGYAKHERILDSQGRLHEERYLDTEGETTPNPHEANRSRRVVSEYTPSGLEARVHSWGVDGAPGFDGGPPQMAYTYDARQKLIAQRFLDEDGKPRSYDTGVVEQRFIRDKWGRVRRMENRGVDSELAAMEQVAIQEFAYDPRGRVVHVALLGADAKPAARPGWSSWSGTYGEGPLPISERFFDAAGQPVAGGGGCAVIDRTPSEGTPDGYRWTCDGTPREGSGPRPPTAPE